MQKLIVRLLLIFVVSLFIAYRMKAVSFCKKNWAKFVFVVFFLAIIFSPVISQFSSLQKSIKSVSQEIAQKYPSKTERICAFLEEFPKRYERVFSDYISFSHWYINLESLIKVYVYGVSPNSNVAVGKNGFYFEGWGARKVEKGIVEQFDNIADYMGQIPFTEEELRRWQRTLEERKYWLQERGITYLFVLAPTKALVYPEYLPRALQAHVGQEGITRYQQLTEYLQKNSDIHFIDLLPVLQKAKKEQDYPLLFYKTDFHWNFYGAFIAYQAIIEKLKMICPQYPLVSAALSEFDISIDRHWAHHRFIDLIGLPLFLQKKEHYITMVPKPDGRWASAEDIPEKGIYDVYPPERKVEADDGSSMALRLIRNPDAPLPSIMLLGDSFLEKCVYFFSADAKEVMNVRTVVNFPDSVFRYVEPTVVVQEILNMFILRKPPENPPEIVESYLKGKFAGLQVEHFDTHQTFDKTETGWSVSLPKGSGENAEILRIAKLVMIGVDNGKFSATFSSGENRISTREYSFAKGENIVYLEVPAAALQLHLKEVRENNGPTFRPESFEIRKGK